MGSKEIKERWMEFKNTGLLWFINTILHAFGYAICIHIDPDKDIFQVYPARVKFRGFSEESNTKGYRRLSEYMKENANELYNEANIE